MTTLYTITLRHPDGRAPLYGFPRPFSWRPEWDGLLTMQEERAGLFDERGVREWLAACKALAGGFRAHVKVATGEMVASRMEIAA